MKRSGRAPTGFLMVISMTSRPVWPPFRKRRPSIRAANDTEDEPILLAGNALLRNTASNQQPADQSYTEATYADMISITRPEIIYSAMEYEHEDISDEDIINYLIETGATMEQLAYAGE